MSKKIILDKDILLELFINQNLSVAKIAEQLSISTSTVARQLQAYDIKKPEALRSAGISKTKQNKTPEEKELYSQHLSQAMKGKGKGKAPWNKGKTGCQVAWNKGMVMSNDFHQKVKQGKANMTEEQKAAAEAKRMASRVYGAPANKGQTLSEEQKQKISQTLLNKSDEEKARISEQQYRTKKAHGTSKTSKGEDKYYNYLVQKYGQNDVLRQYKDSRYPFACDFYIKSLDLFIELNFHWSHGFHPFDKNNANDIKTLEEWKHKAETSKFYTEAINTWTVRDVNKLTTAKNNNLNYKMFYSESELFK